jgi:hypothetical protein
MMPAFAVLEPPGQGDGIGQAERFVFLHEKFSFGAFLFGPLWMISRRLWLELLAYLAGLAVIGPGLLALGAGWPAVVVVFLLIQFLLGMEATSLVRSMLTRRGWRDGGVVIADDRDLAERRFFDDRFARRAKAAGGAPLAPMPLPPPPPAMPPAASAPPRSGVIGLFPEPGGGR